MHKHPLRKFFGLTALYFIIIVGIFVIQFKTESVISKSFGELSYSVSQTQTENNETRLKNRLYVSYRGITFNTDERNPVYAVSPGGIQKPLEINAFDDSQENTIRFLFSEGGFIEFRTNEKDEGTFDFIVSAEVPRGFEKISLPYKISHQYTMEDLSANNFKLTSKNGIYSFSAPQFSGTRMEFTKNETLAKFTDYVAVKQFEFAQVEGYEGTTEAAIARLFEKMRLTLVSKVQAMLSTAESDSLSELDITAYVAELSSAGKYNQAIDSVPDSFKKGNKRTFVSSPFFDNLAVMYRSLSIQDEKYASLVDSKSLDVFNVDGISDYILREKKSPKITSLLLTVSQPDLAPTVYQAGGILQTYNNLSDHDEEFAAILENSLDACIESIRAGCKFDSGNLTLAESDETVLSVDQSVMVGNALAKYGRKKGNTAYLQAGLLIMHSALNRQELELRTLTAIYPILAPNNFYFPHTEILGYYNNTCVWAWTCAKSIVYDHKPSTTANIFIDFPLNLTHYLVINGVPNFHRRIEIQGQMFRTDPRFETYNSSGYVYQQNNKALLLKSRHKSKMELIRLFYDEDLNFKTTADPSQIPELPKPEPKVESQTKQKAEAATSESTPPAAEPTADTTPSTE